MGILDFEMRLIENEHKKQENLHGIIYKLMENSRGEMNNSSSISRKKTLRSSVSAGAYTKKPRLYLNDNTSASYSYYSNTNMSKTSKFSPNNNNNNNNNNNYNNNNNRSPTITYHPPSHGSDSTSFRSLYYSNSPQFSYSPKDRNTKHNNNKTFSSIREGVNNNNDNNYYFPINKNTNSNSDNANSNNNQKYSSEKYYVNPSKQLLPPVKKRSLFNLINFYLRNNIFSK
jgi:hypothetical protein